MNRSKLHAMASSSPSGTPMMFTACTLLLLCRDLLLIKAPMLHRTLSPPGPWPSSHGEVKCQGLPKAGPTQSHFVISLAFIQNAARF